jgi:hypothetical protein
VTPLYPQKLALISPTGGGRSVGTVRSRTKATEFSLVHFLTGLNDYRENNTNIRLFLQNQAILAFIWISETADYRYVSEGASRSIEH